MTIPLTLHMDSDPLAPALVNDPAACAALLSDLAVHAHEGTPDAVARAITQDRSYVATRLRAIADAITNEPGAAVIDHRGSIS